jgi:hypothetical protein
MLARRTDRGIVGQSQSRSRAAHCFRLPLTAADLHNCRAPVRGLGPATRIAQIVVAFAAGGVLQMCCAVS